jgi:hypothetical protein
MTPLIQRAAKLAPEPETAMWFDVGQLDRASDQQVPIDTLLRLPFARVGIAGLDQERKPFSIWLTQGDASVVVAGCTLEPPHLFFKPFAYIQTDDGLKYYQKNKEIPKETIMPYFRMVVAILIRLTQASAGYRCAVQNTFINKKRQAKGKSAMTFDWHLVDIRPVVLKGEGQGGTHASPRLHDRRGHWRTYKATGKRIWVKDCKVGDASKGMVFKDYTARGQG